MTEVQVMPVVNARAIARLDRPAKPLRQQKSLARSPSPMMRQTLALVLAGGRGTRLAELTDWRAKPAVSFGGKLRIIDFALSK